MTTRRELVAAIYAHVGAPAWAAPNLDALADVLRDLSWLPAGPVSVTVGADELAGCDAADRDAVLRVLRRAADESRDGPRPVILTIANPPDS